MENRKTPLYRKKQFVPVIMVIYLAFMALLMGKLKDEFKPADNSVTTVAADSITEITTEITTEATTVTTTVTTTEAITEAITQPKAQAASVNSSSSADGYDYLNEQEQEQEQEIVYITETGDKYHRGGCRTLRKSKIPVYLDDAKNQGYEACGICH